jgi:hypothetical protein
VDVLQPPPSTAVIPVVYKSMDQGIIESVAYYFNKNVGAQIEAGQHDAFKNTGYGTGSSNGGITTNQAGIIFRFPTADITPFAHFLAGGTRAGGPEHEYYEWGVALTAGGGLDYNTPLFHHHLAIRVFQADYEYMHVDWGPYWLQGRGNFNVARLSTGIVYHIGSIAPPPPVTLACSASPAWVYPGDPVTVTATAGNLNPKLTAVYTWTGTGVTGNGATATVATASLSAGPYTVKGEVKEGPKPGQSADCSASFTVKAYEPPTVSCSANPSTIKPGEGSTITAVGLSPQNRPLTYSYSAASGTINGTGTTASFSSTGAPTGTVGITCNVADDKGQTATANTSVTITAPYVAPVPHTSALCSITFSKDLKRPARVDNEAKACLDDVALTLQKQSDATAVVVGDATAAEKTPAKGKKAKAAMVADMAGQRAVNTKDYLVTEKGIDASRISVRTGSADEQKVEDYLVPSGASFEVDVTGTVPVDTMKVKPQVRSPLAAAAAARAAKSAAKKGAAEMKKAPTAVKKAPAKVKEAAKPPVTHKKKPAKPTKTTP